MQLFKTSVPKLAAITAFTAMRVFALEAAALAAIAAIVDLYPQASDNYGIDSFDGLFQHTPSPKSCGFDGFYGFG